MFQTVLLIQLLLVHYATQSPQRIDAACNEDVSLKCSDDIVNEKYISVTWYKLGIKKTGIIRRDTDKKSTQRYNFTERAKFGDKYSLFLSKVTPEDSGTYECAVSAKVGGRNLDPQIELIVNDTACDFEPEPTVRTSALNTTQKPEQSNYQHVEDLPVMWSVLGYLAVGLVKIVLSLICIRVIQAIGVRSSRRDRRKW